MKNTLRFSIACLFGVAAFFQSNRGAHGQVRVMPMQTMMGATSVRPGMMTPRPTMTTTNTNNAMIVRHQPRPWMFIYNGYGGMYGYPYAGYGYGSMYGNYSYPSTGGAYSSSNTPYDRNG